MIPMRHTAWLLVGATLMAGAAVPDSTPGESGRIVYDASYFSGYSASNAEEMIRLVPGGSAVLDASSSTQTQRGFGSAGTQVLINGRRFPGKSNEVAANLRRLSPSNVERIEIISGAAQGVSTQSSGNLLNVVLRPGAAVVDLGNYELNARSNNRGWFGADGLVAYTASRNGFTYKGGIELNLWSPPTLGPSRWTDRTRDEVYFYPNGSIQELRPQRWDRAHSKWIYTAGLSYDFAGGQRLELNMLDQTLHFTEANDIAFTRYSVAGAALLTGTERQTKETGKSNLFEVSAEYEGTLGAGTLQGLAILQRNRTPTIEARNQVRATTPFAISRSDSTLRQGEDIGRLTWTLPVGPRRSLEVGGEVARNTLDQNLQVWFDLNSDGRIEPTAIPTAVAHVQEARAELFSTLRLTGGGRTSFETGVTYERSSITTNYPFYPERTLGYFKPRLDLRIRGWHGGQFRIAIERKVSQLDFNNFVPKFNVVDSRIDAGNPGLRPELTWSYELGYQQRLPSDGGLVELRAYYDDIAGRIEKVPLRDAIGLYAASGNVDTARRYGAEAKASIRLSAIGLRNALLSLRYTWQQSQVADPFYGAQRRISADRGNNYDLGFRHDLTRQGASYGLTYKDTGGTVINSDLPVYAEIEIKPVLEVFAEKKLGRTITLRLEGQNVGGAHEIQDRTQFAVNAIDGTVLRRDHYDEYRDTRFALRLRGQF
jgi:outer membrane receptor protein involved in Fe transport